MRYSLLGERTGLRASAVALGTGRLGTGPGADADEARHVLEAFAAAGGNVIDTSSAYQEGGAERAAGDFLASAGRDDFVVVTKYGRTARPAAGPAAPGPAAVGGHRAAMAAEIEGSLRRLRTDRVDVYMPHFDDGVTPVEEVMRGMDALVAAGKVVHAGLSNFPAWRAASAAAVADARGWPPLAVLQLQYSLVERAADREHLPLARARGLGVMAYSPLAGGRLGRGGAGGADAAVSAAVAAVAAETGADPAAVALAWLIARGVVPVIGPRTRGHLAGNLAAVDLALADEHVRRLDDASRRPLGHPYDLLSSVRETLGITGGRVGAVL